MAEPSASVSTPVETNETNGDHKAERKTVNKPPEEKNGRSRSLSRRSDRSQRVAVKSRSRSRSLDRSRSRSRSLSRRRRKKKKHKKRKKKRRRRSSRSYSRSSSRSGDYSRSRSRSKKRKREREQERSASVQSENSEAGLTPEQIEEKKELERLTRDARTVFVSQLQVKVVETDIKKYFERVCKIKDVVLIKDRFTNRSKGYGYVELRTLEDVPKALLLSGQKFIFPNGKEGFPIKVKASEAEKNFTHFMEKKTNTATATYHGNANNSSRQRAQFKNHPVLREPWDDKIEIKGLHPDIDVAQVKELCEPFGEVADLDLVKDFQGRSTGQCFVHFVSRTDAKEAVRELDGLKLVEYKLKVYKMQKGQISKLKGTSQRDVDKLIGVESDAAGATGGAFSTNTWRLEADDPNEGQYGGGGVAMNSSQKMSLMSKLAGGAGNELLMQTQQKISSTGGGHMGREPGAPGTETQQPQGPGRISGVASRFLLVKNLFDPKEETEKDWDKVIEEETASEAQRFGKVIHVHVEKSSMGNVYICLHNTQSGVDCATALHGRWFAKRLVTVEYVKQEVYENRFPSVKSLL